MFIYIFPIIIMVSSMTSSMTINPPSLRAVTIIAPPIVSKNINDQFEGYSIELLDEISKLTENKFNLYLSPDGYYGVMHDNGTWNGMIGEVINGNADLAIADLTITDARKRVVDFTDPIYYTGITAILSKSLSTKIKSFADLVNQKTVKYGMLKGGSTMKFFSSSTNEIPTLIWQHVLNNPEDAVKSYKEGLQRVEDGNYVFIGESSFIEYTIGHRCDFTKIASNMLFPQSYGIALPKDSPLLKDFNMAIFQLYANGKIAELKQKWWKSSCNGNDNSIEFGTNTASQTLRFTCNGNIS